MPTLRVTLPNRPAVSHVLKGSRVTIGRRPDNTIQIIHPSVSAHHAELLLIDDHYRLTDLNSTNWTLVEGARVLDFHLHTSSQLTLGTVECEYDAAPNEPDGALTAEEMEKDVAFLKTENRDLLQKIDSLQRQIEILSTARLVTGKGEAAVSADPDLPKRLMTERDEARQHNTALRQELDDLRAQMQSAAQERENARRASEVLRVERALQEALKTDDKGATQRIVFPVPAGRE